MERGDTRRRGLIAAAIGASLVLAACGGQVSPSATAPSTTTSPLPSMGASIAPGPSVAPSVRPSTSPASPASATLRIERSAIRLPAGRSRAVALPIGSGIIVCGGLTAGGTTGSILRIDLGTGQIRQAGVLPAPVHDAGGAVLNGTGFIFGGGRFGPGSTVQSVGATGHGASVGHLPAIRADLAAVTVDGKLVLVGGGTTTFYDRRVLTTIDGIHFTLLATLLVGVRYPAVAAAGGLVYVIGGSTPTGDSTAIQAIDPRTGLVRNVGHLVHGLSHASAFVVGGTLFIAGGRSSGRAQDALLKLDPTTGAVRQVGHLPYAVSDMAAVVIGTTGYLIGGETAGPVASIIAVSLR